MAPTTATASINTANKFDIALNNTSLGLAFRDETATRRRLNQRRTLKSATIPMPTARTIQVFSGFSNFFGLNDLYVDNLGDNIWESGRAGGLLYLNRWHHDVS